jgi:hypothetical protein
MLEIAYQVPEPRRGFVNATRSKSCLRFLCPLLYRAHWDSSRQPHIRSRKPHGAHCRRRAARSCRKFIVKHFAEKFEFLWLPEALAIELRNA